MHIASIRIRNFRALKDIEIPLARATVLIGENNTGKSSVLDCISLTLGRRWGQRGTGFSEYDLTVDSGASHHSAAAPTAEPASTDDAVADEEGPEASVDLVFAEQTAREWPEEITTRLFGIIQTDPFTELNSITLRVIYRRNNFENAYVPGWTFLDINGDPLATNEAKRAVNTHQFFKYVPVFFLSALRDASEEFSSRSQFWGRLLKAVEISPDERRTLDEQIEELNASLLRADPRVADTVERLREIQSVVAHGAASDVSIRALPMKVWELLARSEIVIQGETGAAWLPLDRHGQGVKSLSVIYLFNAFVERLLKETYSEHSEPIVALEEPEVHLHPQAVRALWSQIDAMPGQKIIASHSPYFMQYVPIRDIRLLRRGADGVRVHFVPDTVSCVLTANDKLAVLARNHIDQLSHDPQRGLLSTTKPIDENLCREILKCYTAAEESKHHPTIRDFQTRSYALLEEKDLEALEDWARRIRGEVFFSRFWLLCEGQSEVFLLTALFDALAFPLDARGVSLIDYQNNGSARAFACLARTFRFPWALLADGDDQGRKTLSSLKLAGFSDKDLRDQTVKLPDNADLESYIVNSIWRPLAYDVAMEFETGLPSEPDDAALAKALRRHKPLWARRFGEQLRQNSLAVSDLPDALTRLRTILKDHESDNGTTVDP
ncbi:MAG: AAA family ATPase [Spirochaetaceae bacterium]|nr:AAA family ATPase [Spirochaetaceae bacterium]